MTSQTEQTLDALARWRARRDHLKAHPAQANPEDVARLLQDIARMRTDRSQELGLALELREAFEEAQAQHHHDVIAPGCIPCRLLDVCVRLLALFDQRYE